jgi:hypothetical protein
MAGLDMEKVDALFVGDPPKPPAEATPKLRQLRLLLAVAIPLNLLGIPCWTGVPGAALTLWAWLSADAEMTRVNDGDYAPEDAARLMHLRTIAAWTLLFCVLSLVLQVWLLGTNWYNRFYGWALDLMGMN